ncbi:hypothetical protein ES705_18229 [subsurface metagenome]
MNIEKAIEIKSRSREALNHTHPAVINEADKLSLEALKRVQEGRQAHPEFSRLLLPGETPS